MQPAALEAVVDRAGADAAVEQLPARHDTVLPRRKRRDHHVHGASVTFAPYDGVNVNLDSHAPMVAATACPNNTALHQHCAGTPQTPAPPPLDAPNPAAARRRSASVSAPRAL
jgi:hypothetical protein